MSDASNSQPIVAKREPFGVDVESGKTYWWCACGRSAKQPFCDGSHKGTTFAPVQYDATATKKVWFCGCKHSSRKPVCDGAHLSLPA